MAPPWATITPFAPAAGTSISAVTECDLFLVVMTVFSWIRRMPGKSSCVLPCTTMGRTGEIRIGALALAVVEREHVVFGCFEVEQVLELRYLSGICLARSCAWLQSLVVS
jgi:hypothetical protein